MLFKHTKLKIYYISLDETLFKLHIYEIENVTWYPILISMLSSIMSHLEEEFSPPVKLQSHSMRNVHLISNANNNK